MKHTILTVTLLMAAGAAACTKNDTSGPSNSTTTTVATTTSTTSVSTTTTTAPTSFTLTGTITDSKTNQPLSFSDFQVYSGANVDRRWQSDSTGSYSQVLNPGSFVLRGWHAGYEYRDIPVTLNANQRVDFALTPAASTTTTSNVTLQANFSVSPNPCTIDPGAVTNCTGTNQSTGDIMKTEWLWAGKSAVNQNTVNLTFGCGDLVGTGTQRTLSVRLNVTGTDGTVSTTDTGVPVQINGGACP